MLSNYNLILGSRRKIFSDTDIIKRSKAYFFSSIYFRLLVYNFLFNPGSSTKSSKLINLKKRLYLSMNIRDLYI